MSDSRAADRTRSALSQRAARPHDEEAAVHSGDVLGASLGGRGASWHAGQEPAARGTQDAGGSKSLGNAEADMVEAGAGKLDELLDASARAPSRLVEPESSGESIGTFQPLPADQHDCSDGTSSSSSRKIVCVVQRDRQFIGFA